MITKTEAIRRMLESTTKPISLLEAQTHLWDYYGKRMTDSTISRRFRELGAVCERGKDGVYRYSARREGQAEMFKEK